MKRIIIALIVSSGIGCAVDAALVPGGFSRDSGASGTPSAEIFQLKQDQKKQRREAKVADAALLTRPTLDYEPGVAFIPVSVEEIQDKINGEKILLIRQVARNLGAEVLRARFPALTGEIQRALDAVIPATEELGEIKRVIAPSFLEQGLLALDNKLKKQLDEREIFIAQQLPGALAKYNEKLKREALAKKLGVDLGRGGKLVVDPAAVGALECRDACFKSIYFSCNGVLKAVTQGKNLTIDSVTELLTPLANLADQNSQLLLADDERLREEIRAKTTKKVEKIREKIAGIIDQISARNFKIEDVSKLEQRAKAESLVSVCNTMLRGLGIPNLVLDIEMDTKGDIKFARHIEAEEQIEFRKKRKELLDHDLEVAQRLQDEENARRGVAVLGDDEAFARRLQEEEDARRGAVLLNDDEAFARQLQEEEGAGRGVGVKVGAYAPAAAVADSERIDEAFARRLQAQYDAQQGGAQGNDDEE